MKFWSCFSTWQTQSGWGRMEPAQPHALGSPHYSAALREWRCTADKNHVNSKESSYVVPAHKIRATRPIYVKLVNEFVTEGKRGRWGEEGANRGCPCNSRINTEKREYPPGSFHSAHLPNYFRAPTFQHGAGKRQEGSVPAYSPVNTRQVLRFQSPFRCWSMNAPTCIPTNIQEHPEQ